MLSFLIEHLGTIAVGSMVAGWLASVVVQIVRGARNGRCAGCGCGCGNCRSRPNRAAK